MRILHVISSLGAGGAENLVCNLAIGMRQEGHEVAVAYISAAASLGASEDYAARLRSRLERAGVQVFEVGHGCRRDPLSGGLRLRRICRGFAPDVIHAHLFYALVFVAFSCIRVPCVYTHHSMNFGVGRRLFPFFDLFVDAYVGICGATAQVLESVSRRPVSLIYNAVDTSRIVPREPRSRDGCLRIICVGRLSREKNYPLLFAALADFLSRRPEAGAAITVDIAGDGVDRAAIAAEIADRGFSGFVHLLGLRDDVPRLLSRSDVFLLSSDYEGLPIALLEAIGAGLAVVVTDVGGNREVVDITRAGLVVPPGDATRLSEAMEKMFDEPDAREVFGRSGRSRISAFSLENAVRAHVRLYEKVSGSRSGKE